MMGFNKDHHFLVCSFSLLAQRKRTKRKGSQSLGLRLPCAAQNNRALRNSLRSDSPRAFPVIFPLLGYVK